MVGSRASFAAAAVCMLSACGSLPIVDVPAETQSARVDHLVIHFTGLPYAESLRLLTERTEVPVSAHYLVPARGDPTYGRKRLRVHRLVREERRAWHAGRSYWRGGTALNARSIGIEIVNGSRCTADGSGQEPQTPENFSCVFQDYEPEQIELVVELARSILSRHPNINPTNVVGHADIAPTRRADPGPTFPWRTLYERGIGAWYDNDTVLRYLERFETAPPELPLLQRALRAYGYEVEDTGVADPQTRFALRAFQMHFRPERSDGEPDAETAAILFALVEKYRAAALRGLLGEDAPAAETD